MYQFGRLKQQLVDREPVLGTFCFLPSADSAEIAGVSGLDFVIIDMEHFPKDWDVVSNMIRASQVGGAAALVRVARNEETDILQVLELGADGIVIPFIRTANDVSRASAAMLYPPLGNRGTCGVTRQSKYGLAMNEFVEMAKNANEGTVLIGQVEDPEGVHNIAEILGTSPGLDAVLVGRGDLSTAMGLPGGSNSPEVSNAVREMITIGKEKGAVFALLVFSGREVDEWFTEGVTVFVHGVDTAILSHAYSKARDSFKSKTEDETSG